MYWIWYYSVDVFDEFNRLGRLVNYGEFFERNCIMKIIDKVYLCLFVIRCVIFFNLLSIVINFV